MALRILSKAEDRFEVKVGNNDPVKLKEGEFADYIYNPIKAVCAWLFYKLKGGEFNWLGCDKQPAPVTAALSKRVEELAEKHVEVVNKLTVVESKNRELEVKNRELSERLDKIQPSPITESPVTADKEGSKAKKDK